jgi:hypothetical protein
MTLHGMAEHTTDDSALVRDCLMGVILAMGTIIYFKDGKGTFGYIHGYKNQTSRP